MLSFMIDLHCHILPGVDDGPRTFEESLQMLRIAKSEGIRVMVATPHWMEGSRFTPKVDNLERVLAELRRRLLEENIDMEVLLGMEIALSPSIPSKLEAGLVLPLAGSKYVLLEAPQSYIPDFFEYTLFEVMTMGYIPLLAHPERCLTFQEEPSKLSLLWKRGVLLQIDADSLKGRFGLGAYELGMEIIKKGMAFAISTDAHSPERRRPTVSRLAELLKKEFGHALVEELLYLNPSRVLQG